ncbi:MAG: hypothetical protein WC644_08665 [Ignavibacteria bacterium]
MSVCLNNFRYATRQELDSFINENLDLGESYIAFLVQEMGHYLPDNISPRDAAIDLLAEIFQTENNVLIKFRHFFEHNLAYANMNSEEEYRKYIQAFIFKIIQNNLPQLFKSSDSPSFHVIRNLNEAISDLGLKTEFHFSDKYIYMSEYNKADSPPAGRDDLISIVNRAGFMKDVINTKLFVKKLLNDLEHQRIFTNKVKFNDLVYVCKYFSTLDYINVMKNEQEDESISTKLNIKFILDEAYFAFDEAFRKYLNKKNMSEKFTECMYNIINDIVEEYKEGNQRDSVLNLTVKHFGASDKNICNKVQYCIDMFENELIKNLKNEMIFLNERR